MPDKRFSHSDQQVLEQIMKLRRDVRGNRFINKEVSDRDLEKIINAGSMAPSVGLSQPWEFIVIRSNSIKQQIAKNFEVENTKAANAFKDTQRDAYIKLKLEGIIETPVNIAVFYKPSLKPVLGQTSMLEMGEYSVVCAVQNMWLMARALNIGVGWVSILDSESVKKTLNAPQRNQLIAYLCVGYVDEFIDKPELEVLKWADKKSQNSLVRYNRYSDTN